MDTLGIPGFTFPDLFDHDGLERLLGAFVADVEANDPEIVRRYAETGDSTAMIGLARYVGGFLERLFGVEREADIQRREALATHTLFAFKKHFVRKRVLKAYSAERPPAIDVATATERTLAAIAAVLSSARPPDEEMAVADTVEVLVAVEQAIRKPCDETPEAERRLSEIAAALGREPDLAFLEEVLEHVAAFCYVRSLAPRAPHGYDEWVSFHTPAPTDYQHLVQLERPFPDLPEVAAGVESHRRRRDGFKLTDPRMTFKQALDEVDYCLYCHERDKDSCSKGLFEKDGSLKHNPLGIPLAGCPLDEKISEMHLLKRAGESIAALAVVMIDNPMCPGTGHRICNDCMKSCIFQKQEPVNIPQIETRILTDVLTLPYGFEIYCLLTRWNPLNRTRPVTLPYNGKNVLVVGLGPAGYTLAHYLANEGFGVVGIDGLKIEPMRPELVGGPGRPPVAVRDVAELEAELDDRVLAGFGGVSEYGITVRWDKNFLTIIRLALERRRAMRFYGGVRFGGTLELDDIWALGFDHVAIAAGAGRPTIIRMENNLVRGIRKASDFLMALQLTGAFKKTSMANLQVRLPAVIVGGGLTAIDTATELLAYYTVQCEKFLERYEGLEAEIGTDALAARYDAEEREIADEFLTHGRAIREERRRAAAANEPPDFAALVRAWGGVTIAYRKGLVDAPAYRLNHEEVNKALEEGIYFAECLDPREAITDAYGAVAALRFERTARGEDGAWTSTGEMVTLPARSVCVAAGTHPNTIYEKEHPGTFERDEWGEYFTPYRAVRDDSGALALEPDPAGVFTSYNNDGRLVSFYGDNHPLYAGNVVKAMASARDGYRQVVAAIDAPEATDPALQAERDAALGRLFDRLDDELVARVVRVERLTPTIVDVVVRAPLAARKFHPGQFYRLQNYEVASPLVDGTRLMMEGIALTGAWVDRESGLLSLIVLEMGGSSRLCAHLEPGAPVVVMGPTGTPTEIPTGETVLLAGGGLGNAVLFSIAKALTENGNRVLYFAGYKHPRDVFKRDEIEAATDQVVWASDVAPRIEPRRPQDFGFVGNIVECMLAYARGDFGEQLFSFADVDRIIAIGSDRMMAAVKAARHGVLAPYLRPEHVAIGSINSSMQCMMKEICAQCLQKHTDPETGRETVVFSCFNQDQELDRVDFGNLHDRLRMNSVQEKLTNLWLTHVLERARLEPV